MSVLYRHSTNKNVPFISGIIGFQLIKFELVILIKTSFVCHVYHLLSTLFFLSMDFISVELIVG